ncbi:hypothetical protein T02_15067 [Trichinella nativa]|uniref:Uncharacterized protein n=1 Tax=Trichinella nativa TaxID=6335 RepID=A0A0V1KNE8_9BILA|nr:hypothetical protein T02_15067 [Trichinella nativa]
MIFNLSSIRSSSLRNILHQCSYKIDLIPGQKENRPAKMTPESPDFGFACFAILSKIDEL